MENFNPKDICPHSDFCGGCVYRNTTYMDQLHMKEAEVRQLISKRNVIPEVFENIEPCPNTSYYRNKMEYTFGNIMKEGELELGMHKKKQFMSVVTTDHCLIVPPDFNKILRGTLDFCKGKNYSFYHKKNHEGLLRNLVLRWGVRTSELLVNIVTSSEEDFDEDGFKDMILKLDLENNVVGILHTINDQIADMVQCDELRLLYGRDYYMDEILGLKFKVSAFSFFQTNVIAAERLYRDSLDLLKDFSGITAFDLFSGTGTISQVLALKAKNVLGIEIVEEAVESAKANAKLNGLDNCDFIAGDVFKVLETISEKPDVIVVDPPRMGITPPAMDKIISYGVNEILYISCNPKTLAENLMYFEYYGYKTKYLKPFDNFPFTRHVETVVLMSRDAVRPVDEHFVRTGAEA